MFRRIRNLALICGVIAIIAFFGQLPGTSDRFLPGTLSVIGYVILVMLVGERLRRVFEGYCTYMRGGAEDGDLVYVENDHELRLYFRRSPQVIYVPSENVWVATMPDWAKQKQQIIMQRIRSQVGKHWLFEETEKQDRILTQK